MKKQKNSKKSSFILSYKKAKKVYPVIFISCFLVAAILFLPCKWFSDFLNTKFDGFLFYFLSCLGFTFSPLTSFGLYKFIKFLYDKVFWKYLIDIDMNGVWCGYLKGSCEKNSSKMACIMVISHSFNKISAECKFRNEGTSTTSSESYGYDFLSTEYDDGFKLNFSYRNSNVSSKAPDPDHEGFNSFFFNGEIATGHYIAGRQEPTKGTIVVKRQSTNTKFDEKYWQYCLEKIN